MYEPKKVLEQLIEENNGYLITSMATAKCDVSRAFLSKYVKEKEMEKVAKGVYITDDVWPDELFIMQARNAAVIFFSETALYLHGLIDREYTDICITVPTGYNATHLKADNVLSKIKENKAMAQMWEQFRKKNFFVGDLQWNEVISDVLKTMDVYILMYF